MIWEKEAMEDQMEDGEAGLVIFEGGSYSRGPMQIGSEGPDDEAFFDLEQCVNWCVNWRFWEAPRQSTGDVEAKTWT